MTLIKYGIDKEYLPNWGLQEALREVYQNFMDFGEYREIVKESIIDGAGKHVQVRLSNSFIPANNDFLRIGKSHKRDDSSTVGKHGEGLKMAAFVFKREKQPFYIKYGNKILTGYFYDDDYLGECFGFKISHDTSSLNDSDLLDEFSVEFELPENEFKRYKKKQIPKEDIIHSSYFGEILDRPKGEIYVGGHFVCVLEDLNYAYNFRPEHVELDRDRKIPKSFDIEYCASRILENWEGTKIKDLSSRETNYVDKVPEKLVKKFKPRLMSTGKVVFSAGKFQAPKRVAEALMKDPLNQKRIAKLRFQMSKKRTPYSILKEFIDKHQHSFRPEAKADALVLLKKAKEWKK